MSGGFRGEQRENVASPVAAPATEEEDAARSHAMRALRENRRLREADVGVRPWPASSLCVDAP